MAPTQLPPEAVNLLDTNTVKVIDQGLVMFQLRLKAQYEQRLLDIESTFRK